MEISSRAANEKGGEAPAGDEPGPHLAGVAERDPRGGWRGLLGGAVGLLRSIPPAFFLVTAVLVAKQVAWITHLEPMLFQVRTGAVLLVMTTGLTVLLVALAFQFAGRRQLAILLLVDLLITCIGYADLVHYRQFNDLSSVASLRYAGQLGAVGDSVLALMSWSDLWMWADVALISTLLCLPVARRMPALRGRLLALVVAGGMGMVTLAWNVSPRLQFVFEGNAYIAGDLGIIGYHLMDASKYLMHRFRQVAPSEEEIAVAREYFEKRWEANESHRPPHHGVARGKNLILVQLESFQDFVIDHVVDDRPLAPNLRRLAEESVRFTRFFTQSGKGSTADAEFVTTCSLLPIPTGAVFFEHPHASFHCLPESLREAGYTTHVFHANRPDFWNRATVYPVLGFDRYHSSLDYEIDEEIGLGLSDDSFFRQTAEKLEELPRPFYAFVNTLTSHHPFNFPDLPEPFDLSDVEDGRVSGYLRAVHYTDWALGRFVETLRESGILDESILVVYGDHAGVTRGNSAVEDFLDIPIDDEFGWTLAEKQVPMLVRFPHGSRRGVRDEPAGQIDIAPTLLRLAGIEERGAYFIGRDLFESPDGSEHALFYRGTAIGKDVIYFSPDDGPGRPLCIGEDGERPLDDCETLRDEARHWNLFSRSLLQKDLFSFID